MTNKKYCPQCLKPCVKRLKTEMTGDWGYGCDSCQILYYSKKVLLDTPDKEASINYKLIDFLKKILHPNIVEEDLGEIAETIKSILSSVQTNHYKQ